MILAALIFQTPQAALSPKDFTARCAEFSKAKDWPGLEALARAQIAAAPKDAAAQAALGFSLLALNKTDEGRAACEEALKLDPRCLDALLYLGLESAREGDAKAVKAIGNRIEAIKTTSALQFWKIPLIQKAVIPDADIPLVDGSQVHFKSMSLQRVFDLVGPSIEPMVVTLIIDKDGLPMRAEALMGPKGAARAALENAAMRWRAEPILVNGMPTPARFVKIIQIDVTTTTTTTVDRP